MTHELDLDEAQARLRELIAGLGEHDEVVITQGEDPVARLVAVRRPAPSTRVGELHPGAMQPTPDFDEPLPDGFWTGS